MDPVPRWIDIWEYIALIGLLCDVVGPEVPCYSVFVL